MHAYAAIILAALVAEYLVARGADLRNLRALDDVLPQEFAGVFDPETYSRSQRYTRERTRLGMVTSSFNLVLLLAFWFAGGFAALDRWVAGLDAGSVGRGLVFIGALVAARTVLDLPFRLYGTFVLEERYGFNRTTARTFVADLVKSLGLALLLGLAALAALLSFFTYAGSLAWLYAWTAAVAFTLTAQFILPTWIMPLFNRYTPLEDGELRQAISDYATSVSFPLKSVMVMDGSRRSTRANAFFTGFGKNKRIALFDTLIAQHSTPQLVAVIAHEVGHYKRRHVLIGLAASVVHMGLLFALLSQFLSREGLFAAFGVQEPSVHAGLLFFGLLLTPVEFVLSLGLQALSRRHERQADAYAARTTGDSESMIGALKTLSKNNLSNLTPDPFYVALNYSHPPVLERIAALKTEASGGT